MSPRGRAGGPATPRARAWSPSYLTDIEQLLEAQCWDAALREACDLPRIAVALSDPQLRCSGAAAGDLVRAVAAVERRRDGLDWESLRLPLCEAQTARERRVPRYRRGR